ncbi:MAG: dependent oxidoreductase [Myxococcaceae bacterium]|nr:dependent oxidoreductase [Myxococcaceae bacterium]
MKQRIAVLGGGAASLSSVFQLTSVPGWQDRYEITVYQLGWRLGGKGATGRDPTQGDRIEEHGLHLWFGFYDSSFRMMRAVYEQLKRGPEYPIATFEQAFLPHNFFTMQQQFKGEWHAWNLPLPSNPSKPGEGSDFPPPWDYVLESFELLWSLWEAYLADLDDDLLEGALAAPFRLARTAMLKSIALALDQARGLLKSISLLRQSPGGGTPWLTGRLVPPLIRLALTLIHAFLGNSIKTDLEAYRTWITLDAIGTLLIGVLADDVFDEGPDSLNDQNFVDWVKKHGASKELLESCLIQSAYSSSFALFHWTNNPDMEAGTVLRGAVRMFLMYKGSVTWRFAAGTGDTVFAPLYELLKQRGVKFEFFHEVTQLVCPDTGPSEVTEIHFNRQAHLDGAEYQPLMNVKGLPCWPSLPLFDQLVEGEQLKDEQVDLESYFSGWQGGTPRVLKKGLDYDLVVCGLSLDPLQYVAKKLTARSEAWQRMLTRLQTNRTQAFQLWLNQDLASLGWKYGESLLSTFGEPLDTWADLSITLPHENWPAAHEPKVVGYFCGSMTDSDWSYPPRTDLGYPARQEALAKAEALNFINDKLQFLWPDAFIPDPVTGKLLFRWSLLVDPLNRIGPERLDSQWWRANFEPSERYVLSVTGSSRFRLEPGNTGYTNLFLVGDYTQCGLNAGCMEGAIISGAMASRAICGFPTKIFGEGNGLFD